MKDNETYCMYEFNSEKLYTIKEQEFTGHESNIRKQLEDMP